MANTPILPCLDFPSIRITPSSSSSHPLDSPKFEIPPTILPHLETASRHLHNHQTVALPTETVYGLAASSLDPSAIQSVYRIKKRPADNPLIIHVSSLNMLRQVIPRDYQISELYLALITSFWPGPLSLLFPAINPPPSPAPQTNAIRMPSHPLALALIHHSNLPLSAPSANSSGRPSPTQAQHVYNDLNGSEGLGCILDGGDCGVGVESTVINGLGWKRGGGGTVDVLRPGGLGIERIKDVVERVDGREGLTRILLHGKPWVPNKSQERGEHNLTSIPRQEDGPKINGHSESSIIDKVKPIVLPPSTPGMKYRHYSPRVPVYLLKPNTIFPRPDNLPQDAESSAQAVLRQISQRTLSSSNGKGKKRIGVLHFDSSPLYIQLSRSVDKAKHTLLVPVSLGEDASSAAQRLFAGMLNLERIPPNQDEVDGKIGVDAILIEGCSDEGLGLAVMERVTKAVGGGGVVGDVKDDEDGKRQGGAAEGNTFWVDVTGDI